MAHWQMACNRREYSCGCVTWQQWESGAWVDELYPCNRHLIAEG